MNVNSKFEFKLSAEFFDNSEVFLAEFFPEGGTYRVTGNQKTLFYDLKTVQGFIENGFWRLQYNHKAIDRIIEYISGEATCPRRLGLPEQSKCNYPRHMFTHICKECWREALQNEPREVNI